MGSAPACSVLFAISLLHLGEAMRGYCPALQLPVARCIIILGAWIQAPSKQLSPADGPQPLEQPSRLPSSRCLAPCAAWPPV